MNPQHRIESKPDVLCGKPVIKGTRIAVEFVVNLLNRGWSVKRILSDYDHLPREDIEACQAAAARLL